MKLHKKVHHHFKKHHKKYLAGASIGGLGLLAIKIFVLGTGIFGLFTHQSGVFAASYCIEYTNDLSCNDNMDGVTDGPCTYNWNTYTCESAGASNYCSTRYGPDNLSCDADPQCQWDGGSNSCISAIGGGGSTPGCMNSNANNYDPNATEDNGSCFYMCENLSESDCTNNALTINNGPCIWQGYSCTSESSISNCTDYGTNQSSCSSNLANIPKICIFDINGNSCIEVNFCSDYPNQSLCNGDLGGFGSCLWDNNSSCLSETNISSCTQYGANSTMCSNDALGLGCSWNGSVCKQTPQSCIDYTLENDCNTNIANVSDTCVWNNSSCQSVYSFIKCADYGTNETACNSDIKNLGCSRESNKCVADIVMLPNTTDINTINSAFDDAGYTNNDGEFEGNKPIYLNDTDGIIPTTLMLLNNNFRLYLPASVQLKESNGTTNYNRQLNPPTTYSIATVDNKEVLNAISIGNTTESIKLVNDVATLSIPVLGKVVGDPISIYSSQNGTDWTFEKGGMIQNVNGQPYAVFTTNHFTYFAIAGSTGSFTINDDAASTTGQTVTLNISAPTAQFMRLSNTSGANRSSWEAYSTTKSRALSAGAGTKTVYAEFDTDGNTGTVEASSFDSIDYVSLLGPNEGQISLEILSGASQCIYGTSLSLGNQNVKFQTGYTFTGDFGAQERSCTDYKAGSETRTFTIQVSDLSNGKGNSISSGGVEINHSAGTRSGDPKCKAGNASGSNWAVISTPYTIMEREVNGQQTCKLTIPTVNLKIGVGANQAPGTYSGTLTLTIPSF